MRDNFTEEELNLIQAALKYFYEDWNKTKGKEFQTAALNDEQLNKVLRLREHFLNELIKKRRH